MSKPKRLRTILYGDQRVSPGELDLLNTPALQRLYELHQLGLTDRVFIDASHSRLHHVIGVLEQTEKIANAIIRNLRKDPEKTITCGPPDAPGFSHDYLARLLEDRKSVVRLIGLLHDLTHAPYGHTVEDEINLAVCKHDEPKRQADAFYRLLCQYLGWLALDAGLTGTSAGVDSVQIPSDLLRFLAEPDCDPPSDWKQVAAFATKMLCAFRSHPNCIFWRLTVGEIEQLMANMHAAMTALLHLELLHKNNPKPKHIPASSGYEFQWVIERVLGECEFAGFAQETRFVPHRDAFMLDIVGNTVCADLLDYAKRDAHFANLKLDYDADRIAENFTLTSWDACTYPGGTEQEPDCRQPDINGDPFACPCIRSVIHLFSHKLRSDTLGELMNLLNVRFYLYERVIFNPTKCAADAMLGTALQLMGWRPLLPGEDNNSELLPPRLRHVGDTIFTESVMDAAKLGLRALCEADFQAAIAGLKAMPNLLPVELALILLGRRPSDIELAREEIAAGLGLLERLKARRYFRPVFRMLPNAEDGVVDISVKRLADTFRDAATRFLVEREIESRSNPPLPRGSVVIHCPERSTARKVANVLVCGITKDGRERIRKLRHISQIDEKVYADHQKATKAVSEMYGSMWRLVVYVSPQYLERFESIAEAAGKAIVRTLTNGQHSQEPWQNDPSLVRELRLRLQDHANVARPNGEVSPGLAEARVGRLVDVLEEIERETSNPLIQELLGDNLSRDEIKRILTKAFPGKAFPRGRSSQVVELIKTTPYGRVAGIGDVVSDWAVKNVGTMPDDEYQRFYARLSLITTLTPSDLLAARTGQETPGHEILAVLDEALALRGRVPKVVEE